MSGLFREERSKPTPSSPTDRRRRVSSASRRARMRPARPPGTACFTALVTSSLRMRPNSTACCMHNGRLSASHCHLERRHGTIERHTEQALSSAGWTAECLPSRRAVSRCPKRLNTGSIVFRECNCTRFW